MKSLIVTYYYAEPIKGSTKAVNLIYKFQMSEMSKLLEIPHRDDKYIEMK